ncbi:MAG: hypothetical protein CMH27_05625 [Micavibrio sp.]|nr:hypothetical protein [Micavibrio sp.]|tara:strand:+ start:411 stop:725 length:315 start_codon:yes stop_codon:yes gene_type:complete
MIQCANINPDIIATGCFSCGEAIHLYLLCLPLAKPLQWSAALSAHPALPRNNKSGQTHPHPPKNDKRNDEGEYLFIIKALEGIKTLSTGQIYRAKLLMQFLGGT